LRGLGRGRPPRPGSEPEASGISDLLISSSPVFHLHFQVQQV